MALEAMEIQPNRTYEFGPFILDTAERQLLHGGEEIPLTPKAYAVLFMLVRNSGRTLSKDDFMREVWPDTVVEEGNLADNISIIRQALGDDAKNQRYIKTVPTRGYRFVCEVREAPVEGIIAVERERASVIIEENDGPDQQTAAARLHGRRRFGPAVAVACLLLLGLLGFGVYRLWTRGAGEASAPASPIKSIAVLPFKPLAADARDESLELGMADALITRLSALRQVRVSPVSAVRKFAELGQDPAAAGRELGVESVLEGSIQRAGERVRVSARLLRAADGAPLWAKTFDATFTDIFAVQDEISGRVAEALSPRLTGEERGGLARRPTENPRAYQLYLTGRFFWNKRTKEDLLKAADYFRQALELDPAYARAHAGLADTYYLLGWRKDMPELEAYPLAKRAAEDALRLDDQLAEAHTSLARLKSALERDAAGSEREFKRAIEIDPNYATARQWYSRLLLQLGRVDEALAEARRAQESDPLSLVINNNLAEMLYFSRRYEESLRQLRRVRELDPGFNKEYVAVYHFLNYMRLGMYEDACREFAKSLRLAPEREERFTAALVDAYRSGGERAIWRKMIELLPKEAGEGIDFPVHMAVAHSFLGERDAAFGWLNRAVDERHQGLAFISIDPDFEPLRADPRFAELVRRVSLF